MYTATEPIEIVRNLGLYVLLNLSKYRTLAHLLLRVHTWAYAKKELVNSLRKSTRP